MSREKLNILHLHLQKTHEHRTRESINCKKLRNISFFFGYKQLIKQPTRVTTEGCTLTVIILSNNKSAVSSTNIFPLSLSNHDTIVLAK